jgi:DNA-binding NarL/FixJ family response regulator
MQKVIIVDDHQIVIDGYKMLFLANNKYKVVNEANNAEQLMKILEHSIPDIILMDIELPTLNGIEITEILNNKYPQIKVIIISGNLLKDDNISDAVNAGVVGVLTKKTKKEELFLALDTITNNDVYYCECVRDFLIKRYINRKKITDKYSKSDKIKLTNREIELIKCFANGKSYKEIAEKLFISTRTVESHKINILKKSSLLQMKL